MHSPRARQVVLIASLSLLSWLGMMLLHEFGHILGAWLTDGDVERVVFHPLALSRTDVQPNPHPLMVAWLGPLFGIAAPLFLLILAAVFRLSVKWTLQFFAGFCWIANGAYLSLGALEGVGDAGDLLRHGASSVSLIAFGLLTIPFGFLLLHWSSPNLGFGRAAQLASRQTVLGIAAVAFAATTLSFVFGRT